MAGNWRKFDDYHETHQYVAEDGQIIGSVHGSFYRERGWTAFDETTHSATWIGRYVEMEAARQAVEVHLRRKATDAG